MWQDDPALIHQTPVPLKACAAFCSRIPHDRQAPKMADVWPIKNVLAIIKDRVKGKEPKNKAQLKRIIISVWREIDEDKGMCRRLMQSIPARLEAVISVQGRQIWKADYQGARKE